MSTNIKTRTHHTSPYINVTPLIDVLLVMLIIFMVITPLKPTRFKTQVPQPPLKNQHVDPNPLTLIVRIDRNSHLTLNNENDLGTVDDTSTLAKRLTVIFQKRREIHTYDPSLTDRMDLSEEQKLAKVVFIKAPRAIDYGAVARVIDGIKGAGANPVGLQIDGLE